MIEEWRDVVGYEGLYKVSNLGKVKSLWFNKERILKPAINSTTYYSVLLYKNNIKKSCLVHRIVATAFLKNENNFNSVNHINENKLDNNINNLEWCTVEFNNNYGTRNSRISNKLSKSISQFDLNLNFIRYWKNSVEPEILGFDHSCIIKCCKGKNKQHKDYIWRYNT